MGHGVAPVSTPVVMRPGSVAEAVKELVLARDDAEPLAGGTWIMRAPLRRDRFKRLYVSTADLPELRILELGAQATLGASLTHSDLGSLGEDGPLAAIREAARCSAAPAIRNVATLGGNLCSVPFRAADLVPALLAAEADVLLHTEVGTETTPLEVFLAGRHERPTTLVRAVIVPTPVSRHSWFARFTLCGGEYPLASIAISVDLTRDGQIRRCRLVVGAVEAVPRRLAAAERALLGSALERDAIEAAARAAHSEVDPRDDRHAPAWYRREIVSPLVHQAMAGVATSVARGGVETGGSSDALKG